MKITIQNDYTEVSINESGYCNAEGLIDRFRKLLFALGFTSEVIDKHIVDVKPTPPFIDEDMPF